MRAVAAVGLLMLLAGCATSTPGTRTGQNPDLITREEILEVQVANLWEVVNRLRPQWLMVINDASFSGGNASVLVYRDNVHLGGPDALRGLSPEMAQELRWLDRMEAASRFSGARSTGAIAGAIIISTRSP